MTEKNGKIGLLTLSALVISSSIGSGVLELCQILRGLQRRDRF